MVEVSSVLAVLTGSESGLLCKERAAVGACRLWRELRLLGVLVVVVSLLTELFTISALGDMGGGVISLLLVGGEAARGLSSFREGLGWSEE